MSLYPSILHRDGTDSLEDTMAGSSMDRHPEVFLTLMKLILKLHYFKFDGDYFLHGTNIGMPVASTYVNIFVYTIENSILNNATFKPTVYLPFGNMEKKNSTNL